jgi:hypothetical protein
MVNCNEVSTVQRRMGALSQSFLDQLTSDGFVEVGVFELNENGLMSCRLLRSEISNKNYAIYAFVGFAEGGKVLRIGESGERPVAKRILEYPRYINDACSKTLGSNGYFAGGTKPWERDGWFEYLRQFQIGLIFVKLMNEDKPLGSIKDVLHSTQNALIAKYSPPFCNDSHGSKPLKAAWEAINGKAQKHYKRQHSLGGGR